MADGEMGRLTNLLLCGDIMTGRGIDQVLPHRSDPQLHESFVTDARTYVELAERSAGTIERPMAPAAIWGDALHLPEPFRPDVRLGNLETSITVSDRYWPEKGIHYRMHPGNIAVLTAGLDAVSMANNHVLDWGREGLDETLKALHRAGVKATGAGSDLNAAMAPAAIDVAGKGRVLVFSFGLPSSGIPQAWAATPERSGVHLLPDLEDVSARRIADLLFSHKQAGDIAVASIHWGGNWGYPIPPSHRRFAHRLIEAGFDLIHGHSSHHPLGIEVYGGRPILYGCGDLINDYEGIGGQEQYRDELALLYLLQLQTGSGELTSMNLLPLRRQGFRLHQAKSADAEWLQRTLSREGKDLGTALVPGADGMLQLCWLEGCR